MTDAELTDREREVLALRATGKTVPELAAALSITERTANFHLANIYAKLGLEQLAPGERQLRLAEYRRGTDGLDGLDGRAGPQKGKEGAAMTSSTATPGAGQAQGYPVITFRATRLPDGRVRARSRVRYSYRDELSDSVVEGTYAGEMTGKDKDMAPGPVLEQRLRDHVARDFDLLPRPLMVRVVYEGEGLEPVGPGETSFVVRERLAPEA